MSEFIEVAQTDDLKDGQMKVVMMGKDKVVLARVGTNYYAAQNSCPHMGGDLSLGKLEGTIVTCPVHGSQFDLSTGNVVRWTDWSEVLPLID